MTRYIGVSIRTFVAIALASVAAGGASAQNASISPQKLNFPPERAFDMEHIRLDLNVDLPKKRVESVATLKMKAIAPSATLSLDAVDLDVKSVKAATGGGAPADVRFSNTGKTLDVFFASPIPAGQEATVIVDYVVQDPKQGLHFFAPTDETPDAPFQVWSQGESEENRFWFPSFDHPSEKQTTEVSVSVDSKYRALSNGKLVESTPAGEGRMTYHWVQDQPHVSYLVTLVVGDFHVKTETWRGKPVEYWVPPDRVADIDRSFGNTTKMLDFFSDKIGVEYPWSKYAQVCCHQYGGGMENTSATTLGENTLHDERGHIDGDSEGLVSHELAHQWFGDLLTCRDWAHLWLNEGFASYFEALWDEKLNGADEYAYNMFEKAGGAISGGKTLPIVHRGYTDADQQFDGRAYPKGAWVLHMLRCRLGEDIFWKAINRYVTDYKHQTVETDDFRRTIERVSGKNFERFFYDWTERPGCPVLNVATDWNDGEKLAEVTVKQTQEGDAFVFPLTIELRGEGDSKPTTLTRNIDSKQTTIVVPLPTRPTMVRIDPGNTVLKEITEDKSRELWVAQLTGDPDPIGRIRAARALAKNKTDANRRELAKALASDTFWGVRVEAAKSLQDMGGDPARDGLLAGLKDSKAQVRRECVEGLGKFDGDESVKKAVETLVLEGDASYRVESAAIASYAKLVPDGAKTRLLTSLERSSPREVLRSAALRALGNQDDPSVISLLSDWCGKGKPNECRQAAYGALADAAVRQNVEGAVLDGVIKTLTGGLDSSARRVRGSAISALGSLGRRASAALPELRRIAASDAGERAVRAANSAIESITKDTPGTQQLADLGKRVQELAKENEGLKDRLGKLEAKPHPDSAGSH
jgi:aminopeptidase N